MASPDVTEYVDLTLHDLSAQEIFDRAKELAQIRLPDWRLNEANVEVILLEALAQEVDELVFTANRLPGAVLEVLLKLYGVNRDLGAPASATLRFEAGDTLGYTIPALTVARAEVAPDVFVGFRTDAVATIPAGSRFVDVFAVAEEPTTSVHGLPAGTRLSLVNPLVFVERVTLQTQPTGGRDEESSGALLERGQAILQRLVATLVVPKHFEAAAALHAGVHRVRAVDNYNSDAGIPAPAAPTVTTATTGGTLAAGTYSYRVTARNADGETTGSDAGTVTTTGTTSTATVTWAAPAVPPGTDPITDYRVYGRVGGSEGLLATIPAGTTTWTDDGSAAVGAAPPTANSTLNAVGSYPGHVTVAVLGLNGAPLLPSEREALRLELDVQAQANLAVHVMDATVTTVDVAATVVRREGHAEADVIAAVTSTLNLYLDPDTWTFGRPVYRNELISIIDQVEGVDRVTAITTPAADVIPAGVAPLVDLGTATITVLAP